MTNKIVFGEPERVKVDLNDQGERTFFVGTRDGWEDIGSIIELWARFYAIGTQIELKEPLK